ncbi:glycosyltransferase [Salinimicrobium sp. WS361]|uniref:glycosyltransferase n=1 Tax=Salinimicrobium sp. WS361 TaxID=3425123 RepID=UPI003D6EC969
MRILQLIDSLRPGGAERMAVNYANALAKEIDGSFLCSTRIEGLLKKQLAPEVGYLFLNKKKILDLKAVWRLRKFVKENKIDLIQAHGSSWFMGVLLKISLPKLKLVWHDHYGARAEKDLRPGLLSIFSGYFDGIISVNPQLKEWAERRLHCSKVEFIPNFASFGGREPKDSNLQIREGFKIIHLANLKPPKDHLNLFKAFGKLSQVNTSVSLHLIGKEENNFYSRELRKFIKENGLEDKIYFYGEREEIINVLQEADLGVLSSSSEGLPVALLEYGFAGLPVVCTKVGECETVVGTAGVLVPPNDPEALFLALKSYVENEVERRKDSVAFQIRVFETYSEEQVLKQLLSFMRDLGSDHSE